MSYKRRWDLVSDFEDRYRAKLLKRLSKEKSLKTLEDLYQFAQKLSDKNHYKKLNKMKIETLSKIHFMLNKVRG